MQNRKASMPIDINRPQSALLRGVKITEFNGHVINPDPVILQETDFLLDEFLSPTKLKALTGVNDLAYVDNLEMIVDTSETSLGNFGIYLPHLKQLKLNGSHVPRIRDLGTSLVNLKVLWLSRSSLSDLDGIPTLSNLEEVYLAFNEITDLSPCSMLENLKCLDLEGNLIDDIKQIEFLNLCTNLSNLTLYGNPICAKPNPEANEKDDAYSYRHETIKLLPDLKILDDELTLNTSIAPVIKNINNKSPLDLKYQQNIIVNQHDCPFDDDWQLINQFIEEGIGPSEDKLAINESMRPGTSSSRGSDRLRTGVRPLSSMRPLSSYRIKTAISSQRPNSRGIASRGSNSNYRNSNSADSETDHVSDIVNDSSDLTVGPALQGNPLKALMKRRKPGDHRIQEQISSDPSNSPQSATYKTALKQLEDSSIPENLVENQELHNEINAWKREHARKLEERKEHFEPQVLKIEDNDEHHSLASDTENEDEIDFIKQEPKTQHDFKLTRAKSAFKQCFDYEMSLENENKSPRVNSPGMSSELVGSPRASVNSPRSSPKSRDSNSFLRKIERNDSDLSMRLPTGDTGYDSLSSASLSSYISLTNNESSSTEQQNSSYNLKPVIPPTHKPKIVNAAVAAASSLLAQNAKNNLDKSAIMTLKSNLKPLPGIKAPKNS